MRKKSLVIEQANYTVTLEDDGEDIEIERAPKRQDEFSVHVFVNKAQLVAWLADESAAAPLPQGKLFG